MRIKPLLRFNLVNVRNACIIFFSIYMAATILATVTGSMFGVQSSEMAAEGMPHDGWSLSLFSFAIFMFVTSLATTKSEVKFLITRSASRKEIFLSNALVIGILSAILSLLQLASIYIDSAIRMALGGNWRGITLDIQVFQAPNMTNLFVFFMVSFSILTMISAISYLISALTTRWPKQTAAALIAVPILLIALLTTLDIAGDLLNALKFMFTDTSNGLIIAAKQFALAALLLVVTFPLMRRIIAVKQ